MNSKTCECGSQILIQLYPQITNINDYRIWRVGEKVKSEVNTVPVFLCVGCGKLDIPYASMQGKNRLDPDVQAYEELYGAVLKYNNREKDLQKKITSIETKIEAIINYLKELKRETIEVSRESIENGKEEDKQQTGRGSKKNTKSLSK